MVEHWPSRRSGVLSGTGLAALTGAIDVDLSHVPNLHAIVHRSQICLELLDLGLEELLLIRVHLLIELHLVIVQGLELLFPLPLLLELAVDLRHPFGQFPVLLLQLTDGLLLRPDLHLEPRNLIHELLVLRLILLNQCFLLTSPLLGFLSLLPLPRLLLLFNSVRRLCFIQLDLHRRSDCST